MKFQALYILLVFGLLISCSNPEKELSTTEELSSSEPTNQVILSSEIIWEQLNPARGDKSPQAGTIWGDRKGVVATGFLAKFVDGFSSPPHIHNVTYRAMVINGLVHNDDPNAEKMWMPPGSFWTQPAGESHITAAQGEEVVAYVEIDKGPYLVKPTDEAFDNGERPINVDIRNMVWLDASQTKIIEAKESINSSAIAFLWEDGNMKGYLFKLPIGFNGNIVSDGEQFHAVVIVGDAKYLMPQSDVVKSLDPGSYFTSKGKSVHQLKVEKGTETLVYVRTNGSIIVQ